MPDNRSHLEDASIKIWGTIRSLLKAGQDTLPPEEHQAICEEVDRYVKSASDSIPPHLEHKLGRVVRQMKATTLYDDEEPTLVGMELEKAVG